MLPCHAMLRCAWAALRSACAALWSATLRRELTRLREQVILHGQRPRRQCGVLRDSGGGCGDGHAEEEVVLVRPQSITQQHSSHPQPHHAHGTPLSCLLPASCLRALVRAVGPTAGAVVPLRSSSSGTLGGSGAEKPAEVTDVYTIGRELGTGTFGVVRQVANKQTGEMFALKTINKEKLDDHQMKYLEAECEVLKQVDEHPNIVKMHEIYDTPKKLHIVMELVTGGQLLERLATKGLYSEAVTAQCIRSIADALAYCHSKGVVHRDLKPENILLSDHTDNASIKLADFGLSKLYNAETEVM